MTDPFRAPISFNQKKIDEINADHSKIKVGMLKETPFLPVSDSVKRAMEITRKALEDDGYQVVDFEITQEQYAFARNTLIALVINGTVLELCNDFIRNGERETFGVWINAFFLNRSRFERGFLRKVLRIAGLGRQADCLENVRKIPPNQFDKIMKGRYEFAYEFSQQWQKAGISALVTPSFPHCSFKAAHADDMGLMLEYIFLWAVLYYPSGTIPITTV
mgnify:CR=1 FL=1